MKARLVRNCDSIFGVFGYLKLSDDIGHAVAEYCTAEADWLANLVGKSCIPQGAYICKRTTWHKTGLVTFEITGVPNRARILFHPGNTEEDIEGCVLLGRAFGGLNVQDEDAPGHPVVTKWGIAPGTSRPAFNDFKGRLAGVDEFPLSVEWSAPGAWRHL